MRFGVNYVPSDAWWYRWVDWDRRAVEKDIEAIAALGMDHLRIHCLWPLFQPNPGYVSPVLLDRLHELLDVARGHALDVSVTVLNGWLSGFVFLPAWVGGRNIFTDRRTVLAEQTLFRAMAARIGDHPSFLGFDLGNELGVLQNRGHPVTPLEADQWQEGMLALCEEVAPGKLHVNGVDHAHWFSDAGFSRRSLANTGAMTSVHAWIEFTGARDLYSHRHVGCIELPSYCIELAKAYQGDPARKVWLQEFGATARWMPEEDIPGFMERTVRAVATSVNLWGCTWWCSHDIHPRMQGFAAIEYDMGLLDSENRPKPVGLRLRELAHEFRTAPPEVVPRPKALILPDDTFRQQTGRPGWRFASKYMEYAARGVHPGIILESQCEDRAYLASRGITEILPRVPAE